MENKKKAYLISLLVIIIAIVALLFFIVWLFLGIKHDSESLIEIKNSTASLQVQNSEIENFKKNYSDYQTNLQTINQSFVDPQYPFDFITFLETTAASSGITVKTSLPSAGQNKDPHMISFQLLSSDNFLNILDFCKKIENGPYLVEIESAAITSSSTNNTAKDNTPLGKVDTSLLINAFSK